MGHSTTGKSGQPFWENDGGDEGGDDGGYGDDGYVYSNEINFSVEVTLSQENFPYDTNSELRAAPVIVDLDDDGVNEILMADYFGMVRVFKNNQEIENETFPYDTGDQIWGSISSADVDLDGLLDFAVASKSGHLYLFDINGLKFDYNLWNYFCHRHGCRSAKDCTTNTAETVSLTLPSRRWDLHALKLCSLQRPPTHHRIHDLKLFHAGEPVRWK